LPRKPQVFGERDSHPLYRYSFRHNHFHFVQRSFPSFFVLMWNAPLPCKEHRFFASVASVVRLVPFIFGAILLDQ
jgi:hypothetical protein